MSGLEWAVEALLMLLLAATLVHAVRLERALRVLRQDRSALQDMLASFHESTRLAEDGAERFRLAAEIAGRQITRQIDRATGLKDDLSYLSDRAEKVADTLDRQLSGLRKPAITASMPPPRPSMPAVAPDPGATSIPRSKAERDLIRALRLDGARR